MAKIDFSTFVYSISSSALIGLGVVPHPETKKHQVDLELARSQIDILGMLSEKTRGNLSSEEQELLVRLLHDLRLRFVEISDRASPRSG